MWTSLRAALYPFYIKVALLIDVTFDVGVAQHGHPSTRSPLVVLSPLRHE